MDANSLINVAGRWEFSFHRADPWNPKARSDATRSDRACTRSTHQCKAADRRLVQPALRGALLGLEIGTRQTTLPIGAGRFGRTPHIALSCVMWPPGIAGCALPRPPGCPPLALRCPLQTRPGPPEAEPRAAFRCNNRDKSARMNKADGQLEFQSTVRPPST